MVHEKTSCGIGVLEKLVSTQAFFDAGAFGHLCYNFRNRPEDFSGTSEGEQVGFILAVPIANCDPVRPLAVLPLRRALRGEGVVVQLMPTYGFLNDESTNEKVMFGGSLFQKQHLDIRNLTYLIRKGDRLRFAALIDPNFSNSSTGRFKAVSIDFLYEYCDPSGPCLGIVQDVTADYAMLFCNGMGRVLVPRRACSRADLDECANDLRNLLVVGCRVEFTAGLLSSARVVGRHYVRYEAMAARSLENVATSVEFLIGGREELDFLDGHGSGAQAGASNSWSEARDGYHHHEVTNQRPDRVPNQRANIMTNHQRLHRLDSDTFEGIGVLGTLNISFGYLWNPETGRIFFNINQCPDLQQGQRVCTAFQCLEYVRFRARRQAPRGGYSWCAIEVRSSTDLPTYDVADYMLETKAMIVTLNTRDGCLTSEEAGRIWFTTSDVPSPKRIEYLEQVVEIGEEHAVVVLEDAAKSSARADCRYRVFAFTSLQQEIAGRYGRGEDGSVGGDENERREEDEDETVSPLSVVVETPPASSADVVLTYDESFNEDETAYIGPFGAGNNSAVSHYATNSNGILPSHKGGPAYSQGLTELPLYLPNSYAKSTEITRPTETSPEYFDATNKILSSHSPIVSCREEDFLIPSALGNAISEGAGKRVKDEPHVPLENQPAVADKRCQTDPTFEERFLNRIREDPILWRMVCQKYPDEIRIWTELLYRARE